MINQIFARQFIRRIKTQTDYNINIMNEHGIIIASCDEERVGSFHAIAYKMIANNISVQATEELSDNLPGVTSPGVNFLLRENLRPVGVIGVSGDPSVVMPLAKLVKVSFESIYDYETRRTFAPSASVGEMNLLARLLFIDRPSNLAQIRSVASAMGIAENVNRYPVLIEYSGREYADTVINKFVSQFHRSKYYSTHDLLFPIGGSLILLFKSIEGASLPFYRSLLCQYIDEIDNWFEAQVPGKQNRYICGAVQNRFQYYGQIYDDIMWLYQYRQKNESRVYFIDDYLAEFMMSQFPIEVMTPLLDTYVRLIRENMDEDVFRETVGALIESNMNLGIAAEILYLHKNTVASRVKKIKELLGISPLTKTRDAVFITAIYNYLSRI